MDNVTHTLFGATLARTRLGRAGRGTTMALMLASNAPDIDIVTTAGGTLKYLEWHRGPTHGPLGIIGLGVVTAALVYGGRLLLDRRIRHRASASEEPRNATFGELALISILGVLCHVLMDLPTSYGSHLLSPFDWHWYAFDWMPIVDIYLLGALVTGLLIGQRWPSARQRNAVLVLIFMAGNYGARLIAHERAIDAAPLVFGPALPTRCEGAPERSLLDRWPLPDTIRISDASARCLIEIVALPDFGSLFRWRLVARLSNSYLVRDVDILDGRLRTAPSSTDALWRLTITYPNHWTPQVFQAAASDPARVFLGFSRLPTVRWVVDPHGVTTVSWRDLRFSAPGVRRISSRLEPDRERPQPNLFGATVRIDANGAVLDARLGSGN
jgi:inner membrane protein